MEVGRECRWESRKSRRKGEGGVTCWASRAAGGGRVLELTATWGRRGKGGRIGRRGRGGEREERQEGQEREERGSTHLAPAPPHEPPQAAW